MCEKPWIEEESKESKRGQRNAYICLREDNLAQSSKVNLMTAIKQ